MVYTLEEASGRVEIYELFARYVHATDDEDPKSLESISLPTTTFD